MVTRLNTNQPVEGLYIGEEGVKGWVDGGGLEASTQPLTATLVCPVHCGSLGNIMIPRLLRPMAVHSDQNWIAGKYSLHIAEE